MNKFKEWQDEKASSGKQIMMLLIGALIFPTGIPAILVFLLPQVDKSIGIGSFHVGTVNIILGVIAIFMGAFFALWTIFVQIKLASGTPFPMLPTQKLLIVGPFKYCRNPMTLGTILAYLGVVIWVGSFTALLAIVILALLLLGYLKLIEEKELVLRFGQEYLAYKKTTPFILPNFLVKAEKDAEQEHGAPIQP